MASTNSGVAPADPSTPVGQLRYLLGDFDYTPFEPDQPGLGDYANFADAELSGFITAAGGSLTRATGYAYLRLAALAAAGAISWRSDDLSVDAKIPASEFRLLAKIAFDQADAEENGGASSFSLDEFPSNYTPHQELTAGFYGGSYGFASAASDDDDSAYAALDPDAVLDGGTP